jgi:hypothetical protein
MFFINGRTKNPRPLCGGDFLLPLRALGLDKARLDKAAIFQKDGCDE